MSLLSVTEWPESICTCEKLSAFTPELMNSFAPRLNVFSVHKSEFTSTEAGLQSSDTERCVPTCAFA